MNKSFQPTATDIASYVQIIDKNRNGKVTRDDLEEFIIRYFFNPNRVAWLTLILHNKINPKLLLESINF